MRSLRALTVASLATLCVTGVPAAAATYRMVIQLHPDAGGKCLSVPIRQVLAGMRPIMADCNSSPAEIFVYSEETEELKFNEVCVEVWGEGIPNEMVGLGACNGRANQHWKVVPVKDNYQIVGVNRQCLAINDAGKVNINACNSTAATELWALIEAPH